MNYAKSLVAAVLREPDREEMIVFPSNPRNLFVIPEWEMKG